MNARSHLIAVAVTTVAALLSGTAVAAAAPCPPTDASPAFARFDDPADYTLVPGGGFEAGMPDWEGGAAFRYNEGFFLRGEADERSMLLFPGTSTVSPAFCVGAEHPTLRFVARGAAGQLRVEALYVDAGGEEQAVTLGIVRHPGTWGWQPTPAIPLATALPDIGADGMDVRIRISTEGQNSFWAIDDVFYDPWRR